MLQKVGSNGLGSLFLVAAGHFYCVQFVKNSTILLHMIFPLYFYRLIGGQPGKCCNAQ